MGLFDDYDDSGFKKKSSKSPSNEMSSDEKLAVSAMDFGGGEEGTVSKLFSDLVNTRAGKFVTQKLPQSATNAIVGAVKMPVELGKKAYNEGIGSALEELGTGTGKMVAQGLGTYDPLTGETAGSNPIPANDNPFWADFQLNPQGTLQQIGRIGASNYENDPVGSALGLATALTPMKSALKGSLPVKGLAKKIGAEEVATVGGDFDNLIPQVKGGSTRELGKYSEGSSINFEKLNTTNDVKQLHNELTKRAEEQIGKRTVSWEETQAKAEEWGLDADKLKKVWEEKGSLTAAELQASRELNVASVENLHRKIRELPYDAKEIPPELRAEILDAIGITKITSQATTETGRALNILKKTVGDTESANRTKIMDKLGDEKFDLIYKGLKELDFNDTTAVNGFIYRATEPLAKTLTRGAYELWLNGLLSNPKTHIVNTVSNAAHYIGSLPEKILASGIDIIKSRVSGAPRDIYAGQVAQEMFGTVTGLKSGWSKMADAFRYGDTYGKINEGANRISVLPDWARKYSPSRALEAEDAFFKGFLGNAEINSQAYKIAKSEGLKGDAFTNRIQELVASPTAKMVEQAAERAKYGTFQEASGPITAQIMKFREAFPPLKLMLPFVKTPANIMKQAMERTPYGLAKTGYQLATGRTPWDAAASTNLAKGLIGSSVMLTTYLLAKDGLITGGLPTNKNEREEKLSTGWQPYSLKLGDKYVSFARIEPIATVLGLAADITENIEKAKAKGDEATAGDYLKLAETIKRNVSDKTFLQGIGNLVEALNDPSRFGQSYASSLVSSVIPSVVGGVASAIDPAVRDTKDSSFVGAMQNRLQSRIPGLSQNLPEKLNVWGDTVTRPGNAVERMISPFPVSESKGDDWQQDLTDMKYNTGMPKRKIMGIELTGDEYAEYVAKAGNPAKELISFLSRSPAWKNKTEEQKAKEMKGIVISFREKAASELIKRMYQEGRIQPKTPEDLVKLLKALNK